MAKRQVAMGCARGGDNTATWIAYSDAINPDTGKWSGDVALRYDQLDKPLHWPKPRKIFVCSMSDLFHPKVPFEFIDKIWDIINVCRQHTFQILTKRPEQVIEYVKRIEAFRFHSNIWLGTSISTQKEADKKIPILLQIPAAVRFLSIEPMLEGIDIVPSLDWVIVGCESGPKRRPCKIEWVQSIVEQCKAANVPCFVKQINIDGKVVKMPKAYPQELPERP
jgi:protein gp37